jgi:hypothetical protein
MYSLLLTKHFFRCTNMYNFCTLYAYILFSCTYVFPPLYIHIHFSTVHSYTLLYIQFILRFLPLHVHFLLYIHILSMYVHIYSFFRSTYCMHFLISSNFLDDLCIRCYGVLTFIQMYNIRIQKVSPKKVWKHSQHAMARFALYNEYN